MKLLTRLIPGDRIQQYIVTSIIVTKQKDQYSIDAEVVEHDNPKETILLRDAFIQNYKAEEQILTIKHAYSIGDKIYQRYSLGIVPGVVTGLVYDGKTIKYFINFSDNKLQEEFCHESTLTSDKSKIEYAEYPETYEEEED